MFSINFVTFGFCKLFFYHDSLANVAGIDAFYVLSLPAAEQRIFNHDIQNLPVLLFSFISILSVRVCKTVGSHRTTAGRNTQRRVYQLISEHFGKNLVILLQTVAKWQCIKLRAIFFRDHSLFSSVRIGVSRWIIRCTSDKPAAQFGITAIEHCRTNEDVID